jgi:hypothetical protein
MFAFGIVLVSVGAAVFSLVILYYAIDLRRTQILYRAHKKLLFPVAVAGWAIFVAGAFTAALADGQL